MVVVAQQEAMAFRHNHIGTEHLFLGLLHNADKDSPSVSSEVLAGFGVSLDQVRAHVKRTIGEGDKDVDALQIPLTPKAKQALELALREALSLGHNYIGTEHILLGLLRDDTTAMHSLLMSRGIEPAAIRGRVIEKLGIARTPSPQAAPKPKVLSRDAEIWKKGYDAGWAARGELDV